MKFIIWTWEWSKQIGGVRALHNLCHQLNELGEEAYITTKKKNFLLNTPYHDPDMPFDLENTVVIYPECIDKNLLNAKHVVRWILYHQDITANYGENDYVFKFLESYWSKKEKCDGILTLFDFNLDFWKNNYKERPYNMIALRKGSGKYNPKYHMNLKNIFVYDELEKEKDETIIKNFMNKSENFICFDSCSFVAAQAALCGCLTVVIPDNGYSKEQWISDHDFLRYGIAYGFDDIHHARSTQHLVKSHLREIESKGKDTVKEFIAFWKNKIG